MGFDTPNQGGDVLSSSDVDHQQTTNRTHSDDSLSPSSVDTDKRALNEVVGKIANDSTNTTLTSGSRVTLDYDTNVKEDTDAVTVDLSNNQITVTDSGDYIVILSINLASDSNWSTGDGLSIAVEINGSTGPISNEVKVSTSTQTLRIPYYLEGLSSSDSITASLFQSTGNDQSINANKNINTLTVYRVA